MGARDRPAAGVAAGLVGVVVFLVLHAAWITPIWEVAPVGAFVAAIGGTATAASLRDTLSPTPRPTTMLLVALAYPWLILGPGIVMSELGGRAGAPAGAVASAFLIAVTCTGAALGWRARRRRSAIRGSVLAALLLAIGPGHNVPLLAGTDAVAPELALLAVSFSAAAVTLVAADAGYARRAGGGQSARSGALDAGTT